MTDRQINQPTEPQTNQPIHHNTPINRLTQGPKDMTVYREVVPLPMDACMKMIYGDYAHNYKRKQKCMPKTQFLPTWLQNSFKHVTKHLFNYKHFCNVHPTYRAF